MKRTHSLVILSICGLLLTLMSVACTNNGRGLEDKSVVRVAGQSLSLKEFSQKLSQKLKYYDALDAKNPQVLEKNQNELIKDFIIDGILSSYAKKNNIVVPASQVEEKIKSIRSQFPDDVSFREMLLKEKTSYVEFKEQTQKRMLQEKIFAHFNSQLPTPAETEIKAYYDSNKKEKYQKNERIYIRQILMNDSVKADELVKELKRQDFADLAKKYSLAPEAEKGGVVGWIEKGTLEVFDKAFVFPVGGVSPVLESPYGYHIIRVERKAPAETSSLNVVRKQIEEHLKSLKQDAFFKSWLDEQIKATPVFIDKDLIKQIKIVTEGAVK